MSDLGASELAPIFFTAVAGARLELKMPMRVSGDIILIRLFVSCFTYAELYSLVPRTMVHQSDGHQSYDGHQAPGWCPPPAIYRPQTADRPNIDSIVSPPSYSASPIQRVQRQTP
jgi:hypothetical protein